MRTGAPVDTDRLQMEIGDRRPQWSRPWSCLVAVRDLIEPCADAYGRRRKASVGIFRSQGAGFISASSTAPTNPHIRLLRIRRMEGQGYAIIAYTSSVACHREAGRARKHDARPPAVEVTELNPVENIWQYMRDNWLSNRIFANYEDILD
jgi:hypothetical protein